MLLRVLLLCLALSSPAAAAELLGRVVGITDGDTLTLLTPEQRQVRVRLHGIDTPESGQPYGSRAREELAALAFQRDVRVEVEDTDRYGRTVGRVRAGAVDVNAEMVRRGAAWVYRRYSRDPHLLAAEEEARRAGRGLWALPESERTAPWEWRHGSARRSEAPMVLAPLLVADAPSCGAKRTCRQMATCEEARFYLQRCGLARLDKDRDGVPCEALCRRW